MWTLAFIALFGPWTTANPGDEGANHASASQFFGSVEIRLGMPEGEALRVLTSQYTIAPLSGKAGNFMIMKKEGGKDMIGTFSITAGRVSIINSDWTPTVSGSGAFGEALLTLLSHLTSGSEQAGWRSGEPCSVGVNFGGTSGTDTQFRMGAITCGRQTINVTTSRTNAGPSQSQLQLVTR